MDLEHLDNKIPQRWILLVCYYLPLCNLYSLYTPSSTFYFQCRQFINGLKSKRQKKISLVQLPDLLYLLKKYAIEETEQKLANEIVLDILTTDSECFTKEHIRVLFEKFDPNDRNGYISLLNRVFNHIPSHVYTDYLLSLIPNNCTLRHLKWCERLKNKFEFEDRFTLILSLPDNKLVAYQSIFSSLIREECEQRFLNCSLEAHLNDPL
ncbi:hypothetical protein, partial [Rickettsiella grylli]|uniref:hypothetical protein n=1 Tax=Rickettsiella grylli TaxID=59196 RepID=UPI000A92630D